MNRDNIGTPKKSHKTSPSRLPGLSSHLQRSFVPPVLQEVGKLAAGVAAVASGSATGNPRNKHALQPGHSLMDWIRLGSSGKDLTGVGPQAGKLSITPRELALHDKESDAWIAIRGKVYNVTYYLPFHPGGADELMRGIGKDATSLFNEVHAWVNYESLLQKCFLGRLVSIDPDINAEELFFGKSDMSTSKPSPPPPAIKSPKIIQPNKVSPLDTTTNTPSAPKPSPKLPKFDWIQKTDYITIIFYTDSLANPQIEVQAPANNNKVRIILSYSRQIFANELTFSQAIQWPCQIKINYETGKVEFQFRKAESRIWENFGSLEQTQRDVPIAADDFKQKFVVKNKVDVNYNTSLLELERSDESRVTVPIGYHVRVFNNCEENEISRSYTPVPHSLFAKYKPQVFATDSICLMVKSYQKGCVSKYITSRKKGDLVQVSKPLGSFHLKALENRETFLLLAAGTGITPILGLLLFLLERRIRKCQKVTLLFFNRTEEDVLVRSHLDLLQNEDTRFKVKYVLSQDAKWGGLKGQISKELLSGAIEEHLEETIYNKNDLFVLICGPNPFTNLANLLLVDLGITKEQVHQFLG